MGLLRRPQLSFKKLDDSWRIRDDFVVEKDKRGWSAGRNIRQFFRLAKSTLLETTMGKIGGKPVSQLSKELDHYLSLSTVVTLNTDPLSQSIMKSPCENGQQPIHSRSLPAFTFQGCRIITIYSARVKANTVRSIFKYEERQFSNTSLINFLLC